MTIRELLMQARLGKDWREKWTVSAAETSVGEDWLEKTEKLIRDIIQKESEK